MKDWYKKATNELPAGGLAGLSLSGIEKKAYDDSFELPHIDTVDVEQLMLAAGLPTFIPVPPLVVNQSHPANNVTDISVMVDNGKAQIKYKGRDGKFYYSRQFPATTYKDWKNNLGKFLNIPGGEPLRIFQQWLHKNFGIKPSKVFYEIQQSFAGGEWENVSYETNNLGEEVQEVFSTKKEAEEKLQEYLADLREAVNEGDLEDFDPSTDFRIVPVEIVEGSFERRIIKAYDEDPLQNVNIDDYDWDRLRREIGLKDINQARTESCETIYSIDGTEVRLWIVTGGEPAISFMDHSFSKRFPIKDTKWAENWNKGQGCYSHQDPNNIQGPTYDVLPEGQQTLEKFVEENLPKKVLRDNRFQQIPYWQIQSRKRDQSARSLVEIFTDFRSHSFPEVHGDKSRLHLFHPWWTRFLNFLQPIASRDETAGYELFTENEFGLFLELLREGEALGAFRANRRNASSGGRWYKAALDNKWAPYDEEPLQLPDISDKDAAEFYESLKYDRSVLGEVAWRNKTLLEEHGLASEWDDAWIDGLDSAKIYGRIEAVFGDPECYYILWEKGNVNYKCHNISGSITDKDTALKAIRRRDAELSDTFCSSCGRKNPKMQEIVIDDPDKHGKHKPRINRTKCCQAVLENMYGGKIEPDQDVIEQPERERLSLQQLERLIITAYTSPFEEAFLDEMNLANNLITKFESHPSHLGPFAQKLHNIVGTYGLEQIFGLKVSEGTISSLLQKVKSELPQNIQQTIDMAIRNQRSFLSGN